MARGLDDYPLYDPLVKKGTHNLSDIWSTFLGADRQTVKGYLTQAGIINPNMTTAERDEIKYPAPGAQIFNTTTNTLQYFNGTTWV
jgi:hypothetical protein